MQISNPLYPEPPRVVPPLWHLPVAVCLWTLSIFLLLQSIAYLKWAAKGDDDAPDPRAGITLAWGLTAGIMLFFFFNSLIFHDLWFERFHEGWLGAVLLGLVIFPFKESEAFSQALLFSSLPIGILAAFKFLMTGSLVRSAQATPSALSRSPFALLAAGLFTLLQLAGSVASLIALFR
jgi:hypothetical protein